MTKNNSLLSKVKFEVDKLNYSDLQANKNDEATKSSKTMYEGFPGMNFVINGKEIEQDHIGILYKQADNSYNKSGKKDYRPHLIEAFKKMFKYAKAEVPNEPIIQELITSCYLYESFITTNVLLNSNLLNEIGYDHNKKVYINFINPNCVQVNVNTEGKFFIDDETKEISQSHGSGLLSLSSSLEFKLGSNNNKEGVEYTDGKLSLTVTPNSLGVEKDQNLFSKAIEVIKELLEKLFGKEHVTMKEYKFEFNEPKSEVDNAKVHNVNEQGKSVS